MTGEQPGPDADLALAMMLGAYTVARHVTNAEPAGETQLRMEAALDRLAKELAAADRELLDETGAPRWPGVAMGHKHDDAVRVLVELALCDPFHPFQFDTAHGQRPEARRAALRDLARSPLRLSADTADRVLLAQRVVSDQWRSHQRRSAFKPSTFWKASVMGLAIGGVAVAAAPAIAVLMPAAAGLSGAAALSAGLAQLGFGSIAAGGLGMVGGMWVVGSTGVVAGLVAGGAAEILGRPGGVEAFEVESRKLLVSFVLAFDGSLETDPDDFAQGLDVMADALRLVAGQDATCNEQGSPRLVELARLEETLTFCGEFMQSYAAKKSSGQPRP